MGILSGCADARRAAAVCDRRMPMDKAKATMLKSTLCCMPAR